MFWRWASRYCFRSAWVRAYPATLHSDFDAILSELYSAVLKINADELLEVTDDGMFIHAMRNYFATLGDSAHPSHSDPRVRAITNFQELLVVAFREFNVITDDTIFSERRRFRAIIADEIENFSKRAAVRNLKTTGRFSRDQVGMIYDKFFAAVVANPGNMGSSSAGTPTEAEPGPPPTPGSAQDSAGKLETRIDLKTFKIFLSEIATWARDETITANAFSQRVTRKVAEHELIERYVDGIPGPVLDSPSDFVHRQDLLLVGYVTSRQLVFAGMSGSLPNVGDMLNTPSTAGRCSRTGQRGLGRSDGIH